MKEGWKTLKIKDFTKVVSGGTPKSSVDEYYQNGNIGWITPSDLTGYNQATISKGKRNITEIGLKKSSAKLLPPGTVLFSSRAPIGYVVIAEKELTTNQGFKNILPSSAHDPKYLYWYLKSIKSKIESQASGTTFKEVSGSAMGEIKVLLPPLEEQKKIAAVLDKAQALIDKRKDTIAKLDALVQAVFLDMFGDVLKNNSGWQFSKLKDVCLQITDGTHHSPPQVSDGVPYITAKHVRKNRVDFFSNPSYISEQDHKEIFKRCSPEKGDVLYIKDGATTGIAAINPYDFQFSMLSSLALIKPNKQKISSEFLISYLNNERVKESITANMSGAAIKRLTLTKIKDISLPIPNIELQDKYSTIYKEVQSQMMMMKQSLVRLEDNFYSLLYRAFKGELLLNKEMIS